MTVGPLEKAGEMLKETSMEIPSIGGQRRSLLKLGDKN